MKKILFLFFIIFYSCISVKDKNTYKVQNVVELKKVKIIEKEKLYVYDSKNFSMELPYSWRSYQEPQAKEQIRHSPFNEKEDKIETEIFLLISLIHTKNNVRKAIKKQIRKSEYYRRHRNISNIKKEEGIDSMGNFIKKTFSFSQKKKDLKKKAIIIY